MSELRRADAQAEIHRIARETPDRVLLTGHAVVRDPGTGKLPLSETDIFNVLRLGIMTEGPSPDIRAAGGWKFTMRRVHDRHGSEVAGVLLPHACILVITGYQDPPLHRR